MKDNKKFKFFVIKLNIDDDKVRSVRAGKNPWVCIYRAKEIHEFEVQKQELYFHGMKSYYWRSIWRYIMGVIVKCCITKSHIVIFSRARREGGTIFGTQKDESRIARSHVFHKFKAWWLRSKAFMLVYSIEEKMFLLKVTELLCIL